MSTTTYVLNDEGRRQVLEFIRKNGNTRIVEGIEDSVDARDSWFADVDCSENYLGYLEMLGFHTKNGKRIGFVFGVECFDEHNTEADALRDEVARWRKEAAEQAEIAHRMAKVLGHVVEMANDAHLCGHDEWHEIVKEARAALDEDLEVMDGAEAAERENARCLQAMEETADY